MSERWWNDAERDPIHEAAADWFTRLQDSEVTLEETLEWQRWIGEDQRHAKAFARIEEAWEILRSVSPERVDAAAGSRRTPRKPLAIAASVLLASVVFMSIGRMLMGEVEFVRTAVGENRTVQLPDGSQVTLGGDSSVEVAFRETERRIKLSRGEAYFTVAKDAARPFRVRAGEATVVAVGTAFNVRRNNDRTVVAVVEGRVLVQPISSPALAPIAWLRDFAPELREITPKLEPLQLDAGNQTTVGEAGVASATALPDPSTAAAWRQGLLSFQLEPLRYVLEDVNRYASKPIVIESEIIGDLRITGTVVDGNVDEWVKSLESAFGLQAVVEADRIVLRTAPRQTARPPTR